MDTNEFIRRAKLRHGDTYDYSNAVYTQTNVKIPIGCKKHGIFLQNYSNHLNGSGCPQCKLEKATKTLDTFIRESISIHGNTYDYSLSDYQGNLIPLTIICRIHGPFRQTPNSHLRGSGCQRCTPTPLKTTEEFIQDAIAVHGDTYIYSGVVYTGDKKYVNIKCKIHGMFKQTPHNHLMGNKCPRCGDIQTFIKQAKGKPALLYIILCINKTNPKDTFIKVGVTVRRLSKRLTFINSYYSTTTLYTYLFMDAANAVIWEDKLKYEFLHTKAKPTIYFHGCKTECFDATYDVSTLKLPVYTEEYIRSLFTKFTPDLTFNTFLMIDGSAHVYFNSNGKQVMSKSIETLIIPYDNI